LPIILEPKKVIEPFHTPYVGSEFADLTSEDARAAGQLFLKACERTFAESDDAQPFMRATGEVNVGVRFAKSDICCVLGAYTCKMTDDPLANAPFTRQLTSISRSEHHFDPSNIERLYNVNYFYDEASDMLTKCATTHVRGRYVPVLEHFLQSQGSEAVNLAQALRRTASESPQPFGMLREYRRCTAVGTIEFYELQTVFGALQHQTWPA
jgi:hypothetical protein